MNIVAPPAYKNQVQKSRSDERKLERQRRKIEKRLNKIGRDNNLDTRFDNETVSSSAAFYLL